MRDLSTVERSIRGRPIATLAELQLYAYEVPEDDEPPELITRLIAGDDVDPGDLYRELASEGRAAVANSDSALELVETLLRRLRAGFAHEIT